MSILSAYKRSRSLAGLSLTEVSDRSGLLLPNLSAIESGKRIPRVDTLEKALRAAGKKFVPVANLRASAAEVAEDIEIEIAAGREHDLFRFVVQLADNLAASQTVEDLYALVIEPAQSTGRQAWDATIAGVVEYRLNQRNWPVPSWTQSSVLETPISATDAEWVGVPTELNFIRGEYKSSDEFIRRGVFVALEDLESI